MLPALKRSEIKRVGEDGKETLQKLVISPSQPVFSLSQASYVQPDRLMLHMQQLDKKLRRTLQRGVLEIRSTPDGSGTPFRSANPSPLRQFSLDPKSVRRRSPTKQSEPTVRSPITPSGYELLVFRKRKRRPLQDRLLDPRLQRQLESLQYGFPSRRN